MKENVLQTLSLGPRNPVLERFDQNEILAELDSLMEFCKNKNVDEETLTNININLNVHKELQETEDTKKFDAYKTVP